MGENFTNNKSYKGLSSGMGKENYTHTHTGMTFATMWMDLEGIC